MWLLKNLEQSESLRMEKPNFNPFDPLSLNEQLSSEERAIQEAAHEFAQAFLLPRIQTLFREESFDPSILREMGKAGLLGSALQGYGCAGVNYVAYGLTAREIEAVDSGFRSAMSVQSSLVMYAIEQFGDEKQKNRYLPLLAKGEMIGCFALTEPDFGSDPAHMQTKAKKEKGGYRISGNKMWITNSPLSDICIVWAKNEEGRIKGFIVERDSQGLSTPTIKHKLSLRASCTGEVVLNEVFVPDSQLLPLADGLKAPLQCLDNARYGIAWGALGAAETCWKVATNYVSNRIQFERPLAANQLIQASLVEMQTQIALGLQSVLRVGRLKDEGKVTTPHVSLIKRNSSKIALDIARSARDLLGANGISDEYPVMRHLMNLETVKTYEGTLNIHTLILGHALTGIPAFKG